MEISQKIKDSILKHAEHDYPNEACGLIVGNEYYISTNKHSEPTQAFAICPERWADLEDVFGEIQAIVHSHPDKWAKPSQTDLVEMEASGIPWVIVEVREGKAIDLQIYEPSGYVLPLVGREFVHGHADCLTVVLDYYRRERGVELGSYEREDDWWEIPGKDYYQEFLPKAGFFKVAAPRDGDVILMQIGNKALVPNHAAIFLEHGKLASEPDLYPTPGSILHHLHSRLSKRDVYGGYWAEKTTSIWRYGGNS